MNIFETTLYFMSMVAKSRKTISYAKIRNNFIKILNNDNYLNYIGNSRDNIVKVYGRFEMMQQLFEEISND